MPRQRDGMWMLPEGVGFRKSELLGSIQLILNKRDPQSGKIGRLEETYIYHGFLGVSGRIVDGLILRPRSKRFNEGKHSG